MVTKAALDAMVLDGYVGVDDGNYYIKHVLGPIPEPQWSGFVNYVDILAALPTAEPIPEAYTNPDVKHVVIGIREALLRAWEILLPMAAISISFV